MHPAFAPSSRRILVVDNEHEVADMLALLIGLWGHEALVAYDGPSALAMASANPPDVVLLDIDLPNMSGYDLARRLRQLPEMAMALLVAITGYGREEVQRFKESGIDLHFLKPVDPAEIRTMLAEAEKGLPAYSER